MRVYAKIFLRNSIFFGLFFTTTAQAGSDLQLWSQFIVQKRVAEQYQLYFETQPRITHQISQLERVLIRPAVGYEFLPNHTLWLGYLWSPALLSGGRYEQRFWQQYVHQSHFSPWTLLSRTRLEQRWIENIGGTALRLRQMLRALFPLNEDHSWSLAVWDEIFLNLNSVERGPQAGYDQNRFFAGVSYLPHSKLRIEPGYMVNHLRLPGGQIQLNHIFLMMWVWQL